MPWVAFGTTFLCLILIAIAADRLTTRLEDDEQWISHSQDVERVLGRLRGDLFAAEVGRLLYVLSGTETHAAPYNVSDRIPEEVEELRALTTDNPSQQAHVEDLRAVVSKRMSVLGELGRLQGPQADQQRRAQLDSLASLGQQAMAMVQEMRGEEDSLLKQRQLISDRTYTRIRLTLAAAFLLVVGALFVNFRRLWRELRERSQAEEAIRKLNVRLLQVQDSERRKVARELHDSIGQIFAAMKMNLSMLDGQLTLTPETRAHLVTEFNKLLEMGITETRTLSHLLHPPLLDELGFESAAQWLVDGFSQRSNIQVTLDIPRKLARMAQETELTLFRVLQETLTNIHRHSGSKTAKVWVEQKPAVVTLTVADHGLGMPLSILETFRKSSAGLGVGLAGMRERVFELGGSLDIESDGTGTQIRVSLPTMPVVANDAMSASTSSQPQSISAN
jgi:signal transduction histidine kinase